MLLHNHLKANTRNTPSRMYSQPLNVPGIIRPTNSSDDDEFLDTESESLPEWTPTQSFVPIIIDSSRLPTSTISLNSSNSSSSRTLHSLSNLVSSPVSSATLLNVNDLSRNSSSSDVTINSQCGSVISGSSITPPIKKIASHHKGKAPPVPTSNESSDKVNVESETNLDEQKEAANDKDRKKKGLFNYIPSLFKPLSPSNSSHNILNTSSAQQEPEAEEHRLETEI